VSFLTGQSVLVVKDYKQNCISMTEEEKKKETKMADFLMIFIVFP